MSRQLATAHLELQRLAQKRPSLAASCGTLSGIMNAIFTEPTPEAPVAISPEEAAVKLHEGTPLLRDGSLHLDEAALERRWAGVCTELKQGDATALAVAVSQGQLRPLAILQQVLAEGPEAVAIAVESLGLKASLAATVLRFAALPALAQVTRQLADVGANNASDAGFCPICGSWPLLGEARGLEQERMLRCGLCAAAWTWRRLHCPFCGNRDHQTLGYLHVEGEEDRLRAGTCEECRGYVKWTSTMFPLSTPQLLVADLATLHLDLAAAERGYFVH
jgi:FdhE protein